MDVHYPPKTPQNPAHGFWPYFPCSAHLASFDKVCGKIKELNNGIKVSSFGYTK